MTMDIVFLRSADEALELVESHLSSVGPEGELAYGLLGRLRDDPDAWGEKLTLLVGHVENDPVALVVRTGKHPALITGFVPEPEIDYAGFVREMQRLDHAPPSVNGAVCCSVPFAAAWATECGIPTRTLRDTRAFQLRELRAPADSEGHARPAAEMDRDMLQNWCTAFGSDIGEPLTEREAAKTVTQFVESSDMMLWVVNDKPVSMAAINRRTPNSSCVAWVYTPPEARRHGHASSVVAALTQRELDAGVQWCSLFTDLANPTSNHIYMELGYEPHCDFRHIELVW